MKTAYDKTHPVAMAIAPVKADAILAAQQYANKIADECLAELAAANWCDSEYAPYPSYRNFNVKSYAYFEAQRKYQLVNQLTKWVETSRGLGGKTYVVADAARRAKFIQDHMDNAAAQYELFTMKLIRKIGACDSATLEGNHVWSISYLHVTKSVSTAPHRPLHASVQETWKTKQIWNVSKLGKEFPQWPSRKMKP